MICKVICKGILGVRPYISSWGTFQSSQLWCSHGHEIIGRSKERMPSEYGAREDEHRALWECQVSIECDGEMPYYDHLGGVNMSIGHDQH